MARIIAVSNQKGGVGKTTTTLNLAAAVARAGRRVLLVDIDPQGNASSGLGITRDRAFNGVAEAMLGLEAMASCVHRAEGEELDVCPATAALQGAEIELYGLPNRENRLAFALAEVGERYDLVFIDTPPSLGMLTLNALVAADSVLVPLQAEYYAMEGLGELIRTINAVRRGPNPRLVREGVVITMSDSRNNLCREVERQAREVLGEEVFRTVVPRTVRLAEAPSHGRSIFAYDPGSRAASSYRALGEELLGRVASVRGAAAGAL